MKKQKKQKEITPKDVIALLEEAANRCQFCSMDKKDHDQEEQDQEELSLAACEACEDFVSDLCSVGQERLKWWKTKGIKFRTARAALRTWTPRQFAAWADYVSLGLSPKGESLLANLNYVDDRFYGDLSKKAIEHLLDMGMFDMSKESLRK